MIPGKHEQLGIANKTRRQPITATLGKLYVVVICTGSVDTIRGADLLIGEKLGLYDSLTLDFEKGHDIAVIIGYDDKLIILVHPSGIGQSTVP